MTLAISRTRPLRQLLAGIGSSTYRLNTILVGLDCVAKGEGDGGAIAVTWTKPRSEAEAKNAAAQARSFACAGTLVLAADVFDVFIRDFSKESWLNFSAATCDIATKAVMNSDEGGRAYSVAERAEALATDLNISDVQSISLIDLFAKWRNVIAHEKERKPALADRAREELLRRQQGIREGFAHLSIAHAIENFEQRKVPVPKEVTSLVANAVRFARSIDEAAIRRVAATREGIEVVAEHFLLRYFSSLDVGKAKARISDLLQGDKARRANNLSRLLSNLGISASSNPISAPLNVAFLTELAELSPEQFRSRYLADLKYPIGT